MRFVLCLVGLLATTLSARAMELGQTRDAVVAQHGRATEENHSKNTATYRRAGWKVDLQYRDDIACTITFSKVGQLTDEEIQAVLTQNAGGLQWTEADGTPSKRVWQRTDFATAQCDRLRPASLTFSQAPPQVEQPSQQAMVEAEPSPQSQASDSGAYAIESHPEQKPSLSIGLTKSALGVVQHYPLVFAIPAVLLVIALGLGRRKKVPVAATPARRVVTPRPINDAMAAPASITPGDLGQEDFELLVGEIFRRKGYQVEISGGIGADGGSELCLRHGDEVVLVQCRQWGNWKVSAPPMQEFLETMKQSDATRGIFVTPGDYTEEARTLADGKPVELVDGVALNDLISEVTAPGEDLCELGSWLDGFALNVTVMEPACPFCRERMTLKRGVQGRAFWSCRTFPSCAGKRESRMELLQRLPGFASS